MKKNSIAFLFFLCLITINIFGENIHSYSFELISKISIGNLDGELGFEIPMAGSPSSPYTIYINKNNEILIPDIINNRINIYDLDLNFKRSLKNVNDCRYARKLDSDDNGNIFCLIGGAAGLIKINPAGEKLFQIKKYSLPRAVYQHKNYFIINNNFFFYDENNGIKTINDNGRIEDFPNAKQTIKTIETYSPDLYQTLQNSGLSKSSIVIFNTMKNESGLLFIGDYLYNSDFQTSQDFFTKIAPVRKEMNVLKNENYSEKNLNSVLQNFSSFIFIAYDKNHNSYWRGSKFDESGSTQIIIILSNYGELIDSFYYGQYRKQGMGANPDRSVYKTSGAKIAVSWDGDMFFMCSPLIESEPTDIGTFNSQIVGEQDYAFCKVTRKW